MAIPVKYNEIVAKIRLDNDIEIICGTLQEKVLAFMHLMVYEIENMVCIDSKNETNILGDDKYPFHCSIKLADITSIVIYQRIRNKEGKFDNNIYIDRYNIFLQSPPTETLSQFSETEVEVDSNMLQSIYERMLHEQRGINENRARERENQLTNQFRTQTHEIFDYFMNNIIGNSNNISSAGSSVNIATPDANPNITTGGIPPQLVNLIMPMGHSFIDGLIDSQINNAHNYSTADTGISSTENIEDIDDETESDSDREIPWEMNQENEDEDEDEESDVVIPEEQGQNESETETESESEENISSRPAEQPGIQPNSVQITDGNTMTISNMVCPNNVANGNISWMSPRQQEANNMLMMLMRQYGHRQPSSPFMHQAMVQHTLNNFHTPIGNDIPQGYQFRDVRVVNTEREFNAIRALTLDELMQLPVYKSTQCSICLDDYATNDNISLLDCEHYYHRDCIAQWLKEDSNKCPICRKSVGKGCVKT